MDDPGGFGCLGILAHGPGAGLFRSCREIGDEGEQVVTGPNDAGQAGFGEAHLGQESDALIGLFDLRHLSFDRGGNHDAAGALLGGPSGDGFGCGVTVCRRFFLDVAHIEHRFGGQQL